MKIISSKKWEEINQKFVDLQLELNDAKEDNKTYLKQIELLRKTNNELGNFCEQIPELKKEIKKLKTLCTKSNVDWQILYKKEGK